MTVRKLLVAEWAYFLGVLLAAIGIVAGGIAYRMEQIDDVAENLQVRQLMALVQENRNTLQFLQQTQRLGPRHTACDTKKILADLRAQGVQLPPYEVEDRCKDAP